MSEIEQMFRDYLGRHPEVRALLSERLVNIRALARSFISENNINVNVEAIVAMIRRAGIEPLVVKTNKKAFYEIKIGMKDEIVILDYEKSKDVMDKIKDIISSVSYDKNETLKVVVGSDTIKIIVDSTNAKVVIDEVGRSKLIRKHSKVSEASLLFSSSAMDEKGIISYVSSQLLINGINIREIITCTPELIIYVDEEQSLKAFEVFKRIKNR